MEDLIQHKNRFILSVKTEPIIEKYNKDVWNGRDSDELHGWDTETVTKRNGTKVIVSILVPDQKQTAYKKEAIDKINEICKSAHMPMYKGHIKINYEKQLYSEFEIEDNWDVCTLYNSVMIHQGIRGCYPVPMYYVVEFDIYGMLWSSELKIDGDYEENLLSLVLVALEEKGIRLDERYIN